MKEIEVGDEILEFPDSMSDDEILAVLRAQYKSPPVSPDAGDDDTARHQARASAFGADPNKQAMYLRIEQQMKAIRARQNELAGKRRQNDDEVFEAEKLRNDYAALAAQLPSEWKSTAAGIGGAVVGGIAGAPGGVYGSIGGSMVGGALGTVLGAIYEAKDQNMSDAETKTYLLRKGIESIAFDAVGNIVFFGGGKVLGTLAKNTAAGKWVISKIGNVIKPHTAKGVKEGDRVFADTTKDAAGDMPDFTPDETIKAQAKAAADALVTPRANPEKPGEVLGEAYDLVGSQRGDAGIFGRVVERAGRNVSGRFDDQATELARRTEALRDAAAKDLSPMNDEAAGGAIQQVAKDYEAAVKAKYGPDFDRLRNPESAIGSIAVDTSAVKKFAEEELARDTSGIALTAEERAFLQDIAGLKDEATLAELHGVWSAIGARLRDMDQPGRMSTPLKRLYSVVREKLDTAMQGTVSQEIEHRPGMFGLVASDRQKTNAARTAYREMAEVIDDKGLRSVARSDDERVGELVFRNGSTARIDEINEMGAQIKKLGDPAMVKQYDDALAGLRTGYLRQALNSVDSMANLPKKMREDPKFARTFLKMFPEKEQRAVIEKLSQAAQISQRGMKKDAATNIKAGMMQLVVGAGGGALFHSVTAGAAGAGVVIVYLSSHALAHIVTRPSLRWMAMRTAALSKGAAGASTVPANAARLIKEFADAMKADGFDITQPPPANEAAAEPEAPPAPELPAPQPAPAPAKQTPIFGGTPEQRAELLREIERQKEEFKLL